MSMMPDHSSDKRPLVHYGAKVIIRDGSSLDGKEGLVVRAKDGEVQVLLDQEVFWIVAEQKVEALK